MSFVSEGRKNSKLFFYFNGIFSSEHLFGLQMLYPILIFILSCIMCFVATTVPWFNTDKRGILGRWRPQSDNRRIKMEAEIRAFSLLYRVTRRTWLPSNISASLSNVCVSNGNKSFVSFRGYWVSGSAHPFQK